MNQSSVAYTSPARCSALAGLEGAELDGLAQSIACVNASWRSGQASSCDQGPHKSLFTNHRPRGGPGLQLDKLLQEAKPKEP